MKQFMCFYLASTNIHSPFVTRDNPTMNTIDIVNQILRNSVMGRKNQIYLIFIKDVIKLINKTDF